MAPEVRPVMLLVNVPVPVPSVVWLPVMVGLCEVLQQTPRAVTVAPPSAVTLPPQDAEEVVMEVTFPVVTEGRVEVLPLRLRIQRMERPLSLASANPPVMVENELERPL